MTMVLQTALRNVYQLVVFQTIFHRTTRRFTENRSNSRIVKGRVVANPRNFSKKKKNHSGASEETVAAI